MRDWLAGLKVLTGFKPPIAKDTALKRDFIPPGFKAVCLISADLEGAWAFCHSKSARNDKDRAIRLGLKTRENVPRILSLCERYDIPITWATVGHLFLDKCTKEESKKHPNLPRIPYFSNEFWEFFHGDWFDNDPCTDETTDPAWYGKDIIESIQSAEIRHEIGCHTFSHIDCSDARCPQDVFNTEMRECQKLAEQTNIKLSAFVHPGHQIGHLKELAELGFTSYRTDDENCLGLPLLHETGLWNYRNTVEIARHDSWSAGFHGYFFRSIIRKAIKHNKVAVLWFHPSLDTDIIKTIMQPLFSFLNANRSDIWITTHSEYSNYLNKIK